MILPGVIVRDNDSFEGAMKKFKKLVEKSGVLSEVRKREFYEKPSVRKKKKHAAALKRLQKKTKR